MIPAQPASMNQSYVSTSATLPMSFRHARSKKKGNEFSQVSSCHLLPSYQSASGILIQLHFKWILNSVALKMLNRSQFVFGRARVVALMSPIRKQDAWMQTFVVCIWHIGQNKRVQKHVYVISSLMEQDWVISSTRCEDSSQPARRDWNQVELQCTARWMKLISLTSGRCES